jgi:hypothetical protein
VVVVHKGGLIHRTAIACFLAITAILGGCMDLENTLRLESGAVTVTSRMVFDKEMEDVFAYIEYVAGISKNPDAAIVSSGLCASLGVAGASAPEGTTITSRQYKEQDRLVCEVRVRTRNLPEELQNLGGLDFFTITENPQLRQKTLVIDFEKLPDLSPFLMAGMVEQIKKNAEFSETVSNKDMVELMGRTKTALIAIATMGARGRYVEFAVTGARIIETDGKISDDGRSARLRMTYAELVEMLLNPSARRGKKFFVTVAF